ncbi:MFS transporter [Streptomyces sp. NPDC050617]|uniref:MFS transporter n=1 Tax=Streptomyces sp. NPDC050617 TaxID=3154628 RepID=UPI00343CA23D
MPSPSPPPSPPSPPSPSPPSPPPDGAARTYENKLLLVLFLAFGFVFFDRQALSFLAPFISDDFHLSHTQLGTLSGVLALTWALSGLLCGRLSDRLGRRKPLLITAVVLFSCFSAAGGLVTGFAGLLLARALMGVAEGAVLPLSQSLMVEASRAERRGLNMGLLQGSSAGLLGGILSPLAVVWVAGQYGWRTAFLLTIVPGLLIAAWIWRSVRERPPGPRAPAAPVAAAPSPAPAGEHLSIRELLGHRNILLCVLAACSYLTWFIVIITFTPTYLEDVKGFSSGTMSRVMTCFGVAWVLWGFVTPAVSDRIGRRRTMILFSAVAAVCPLAVVYLDGPVVLGAVVILTYTGLGCFTLIMATIPAETVPRGSLATALGLVMGAGELAGGFLAPVIAGRASDAWGPESAMFISAGGAVAVVLISFGLRETAPEVLRRRAAREAARALEAGAGDDRTGPDARTAVAVAAGPSAGTGAGAGADVRTAMGPGPGQGQGAAAPGGRRLMRAAVWYGAGDVRVVERDVPEPGPGEVLVAVAYCGICGSDLHEYADGPHAIPVAAPHPASGATAPLVLGHEFCGTVAALGPGVAGLAVGDSVAVEPHYRCGDCARCRAGEYNICRHFGFAGLMGDGGLAEFAALPAYMAHRLPPDVPLEQAALFEPASVALHALRRAGPAPAALAVVGLGPIGLLTVRLAAERGVPRIIAADVAPDRLELAERLGATDTVDARRPADADGADGADSAGAAIRELTGGEGVDVAFEAVGSQDALDSCLAATRRGGRVVLVGLGRQVRLDAYALVNNEQSIVASVGYRDTYPELIRLVRREGVDLTPVVTSTVALDDVVAEGLRPLSRGPGGQIKILVRPEARADGPDVPESAK